MSSRNKQVDSSEKRLTGWRITSSVALGIAILALVTSCFTSQYPHGGFFGIGASVACPTPTTSQSPAIGLTGKKGYSAYDLWLQMGHKGTVQQFLDSLVGEKGKDGAFYGSNGLNGKAGAAGAVGSAGEDGLSAYQIWLQTNPDKTEAEFLSSLVGPTGTAGVGGLSAYDLWLVTHPGATLDEFIAQLTGTAGTDGTDGLNGQSAYELWLETNPGKTEAEFIASLKGDSGNDGICQDGTNGTNGIDGQSAYQTWLTQPGNSGSEATFLASLLGPQGIQGVQGIQGEQGPRGEKGDTGSPGVAGGYYLAMQDTTTQTISSNATANPMQFGTTDSNKGFTVTRNAGHTVITINHTGAYYIQYSAQWTNSDTSKDWDANVWLRVNGSDLSYTSTYTTVPQKHATEVGKLVSTVNYLIEFNQGDTIEFYWWAQDPAISIETIPVQASNGSHPAMPASPGLIMSINQVG